MRIVIALAALLALATGARADDTEEARREYKKGMGAFALGNYDEAAQHYERAFALKQDPALLYNAAQSQRLAGNKQRALLLYENLQRLFPAQQLENKAELERHIRELRTAIESETVSKSPPNTTAQPNLEPPAPAPSPAPVAAAPAPVEKKPARKAWIWGVVAGGIAVVALAVGLGVGLGVHPSDPTASLGAVTVH